MDENQEMRDAYHDDYILWGQRISDMVARVVVLTEMDLSD